MSTNISTIDKNARIAIIGAAPAGLSTAWFLKKQGFTRVTVLEKLGRVGGLCKSITIDGRSYDLGANYLTWAYTETLAIANKVGAKRYKEKPYTSIDVKGKKPEPDGKVKDPYRPLKEAILVNPFTGQAISKWQFAKATLRYLKLRYELVSVIDRPDYLARINRDTHPELCKPFSEWLLDNKLGALGTLFEFPITIMGYGQLRDIPTPYALRYMSLKTFFPMVANQVPFVNLFFRWPKRFKLGFQRMWEKVSWLLNVRLNVDITEIRRSDDGIQIDFEIPQQELNDINKIKETMSFDYLILACPLTPDVFTKLGLQRNEGEMHISDKIVVNPYCMTTYWVDNMIMHEPVAPILPLLQRGKPWAVARQFQHKGNYFTQFYTRPTFLRISDEDVDGAPEDETWQVIKGGEWNAITTAEWNAVTNQEWDEIEKDVKKKVEILIEMLGGKIDPTKSRWRTYDRFTYFQHVTSKDIGDGYYEKLESQQGVDRTFYVGGVTDFELVEPIVKHSKYLVEKHFKV